MSYTIKNLRSIDDAAARHGFSEIGEARFPRSELDAKTTGLAYHVLRPGRQQAFGHRHEEAEEIHVVLSGSGRMKLDDDVIELDTMDAIRVAPHVARSLEAGPDGLEVLVFGPHHPDDRGEIIQGFWQA